MRHGHRDAVLGLIVITDDLATMIETARHEIVTGLARIAVYMDHAVYHGTDNLTWSDAADLNRLRDTLATATEWMPAEVRASHDECRPAEPSVTVLCGNCEDILAAI